MRYRTCESFGVGVRDGASLSRGVVRQVVRSQVSLTKKKKIRTLGLGTVPYQSIEYRVADPAHFRPDPDPANQNFKTGSRIRILLLKKATFVRVKGTSNG